MVRHRNNRTDEKPITYYRVYIAWFLALDTGTLCTIIHPMTSILEKHQQLLEAQEAKQPQLSLREMGGVIGSESPGYVSWLLSRLVALGLAEKIERGGKHVYRIVPAKYRHNPESHE